MLSDFDSRGVVVLGSVAAPDLIVPQFRKLAEDHFPQARTHILVKQLSPSLRLLMTVAKRREAPYNILLRLDFEAAPDEHRREALERFRADVATLADEVLVFQTVNTQFHNLNCAPTDVAMAFINTWPTGMTKEQAQQYWRENHGPLVRQVGLPPAITSYTQIHFDDSFDQTYQGLSFETITSQWDLVKCFIMNSSLRKLNRILLEDEKQFTGPPLFFAFRTLAPGAG